MRAQEPIWFNHERLDLYWEVIGVDGWLSEVMESLVRTGEIKDQLDRASNSIALNLAMLALSMMKSVVEIRLAQSMSRCSLARSLIPLL